MLHVFKIISNQIIIKILQKYIEEKLIPYFMIVQQFTKFLKIFLKIYSNFLLFLYKKSSIIKINDLTLFLYFFSFKKRYSDLHTDQLLIIK